MSRLDPRKMEVGGPKIVESPILWKMGFKLFGYMPPARKNSSASDQGHYHAIMTEFIKELDHFTFCPGLV